MDYNQQENSSVENSEDERVFEVALSLVPAAQAFARKYQLSSELGREVMMEAAKRVVEIRHDERQKHMNLIANLPGYLFSVARHLMLDEFKRQRNEVDIDNLELPASEPKPIENRILVSELVQRMNPKSRIIFRYRTLGYDYGEIAEEFRKAGQKATEASLRSEFSKTVKQIILELEGGTPT